MLFTLIIPIEVIYAKESLGTTSAGYGVLLAAWGAGIVVGSLIYLRVKHRSAFGLVVYSTLAIAVAYLGLASAGTLIVACAISIVGGAGNGIQWIAVMTALQERTPRDVPGADQRAHGVDRRRHAGRRLPARRRDRGDQLDRGPPTRSRASACSLLVLLALPLRSRLDGRPRRGRRVSANGTPLDIPLPERVTADARRTAERGSQDRPRAKDGPLGIWPGAAGGPTVARMPPRAVAASLACVLLVRDAGLRRRRRRRTSPTSQACGLELHPGVGGRQRRAGVRVLHACAAQRRSTARRARTG